MNILSKRLKLSELVGIGGLISDGDWIESKDQDPNGDVRLVQLADIGDGYFIDKSKRFLTSAKAFELRCTFLKAGDLLVARMPDPIGRACIFPCDQGLSVTAVDVCVIRPDGKLVDSNWLKHALNSQNIRREIENGATGTTRSRIATGRLKNLEFQVPSLQEQKRIAAILDKAESVSHKRQQAISLADDFLREVFIDLFGDPVSNPMGWPVSSLPDIAAQERYAIVDGPFGSALSKDDYRQNGVPIIRIKNLSSDGSFVESGFLYISEELWEKNRRSAVREGDVLISRVGTLGNCCIFPRGYDKALLSTTGVCKVTIDNTKASNIFVHRMILMPRFQAQIKASSSTSVQPYFNLSALKSWRFGLPPLELQLKYKKICEKVGLLLSKISSSEEDARRLISSIQNKVFL